MTKLVVDSSVALKWFFAEPHSTEARRVLDGYLNGSLSFLAPDLLNAEFGNVVWKRRVFHGLDAADALDVVNSFRALQFSFVSAASLLADAFRIASAHKRTVYDSLYLALSVREGCRLVTADERLVNAVGASFPNLVWVANWP